MRRRSLAKACSPDRCDAMIWAMTELMLEREPYADSSNTTGGRPRASWRLVEGHDQRCRHRGGASRPLSCRSLLLVATPAHAPFRPLQPQRSGVKLSIWPRAQRGFTCATRGVAPQLIRPRHSVGGPWVRASWLRASTSHLRNRCQLPSCDPDANSKA
jgi:hypothetical protein